MVSLNEREKAVLTAVVLDYVNRKEPIGSRTLTKDFDLGISAATIRNTMLDLEEKGLITQPHTSAGRIPTDAGYRIYVTELMQPNPLTSAETMAIRRRLMRKEMSMESILNQAAEVVAGVSHQLGVILAPSFEDGVFDNIKLFRMTDNRVMAILTLQSRLFKTVVMEVLADLAEDEIIETAELLNQRLHGLKISAIRTSIRTRMADVGSEAPKLISLIADRAEMVFQFNDQLSQLQYGGTSNLLNQPEFLDMTRLKSIIELLEERTHLTHILKMVEGNTQDVTIIIGHENKEHRLRECSMVAAPYSVGSTSGVISVVGPTRMSYARLISLVRYTAKYLEEAIESTHEQG